MGRGQTGFAKVIALDRCGWHGPIVPADHCPPGKSVTCSIVDLSSPITKNILLRGWVETAIHQANPVPERGAFRDRHGRGMGCDGRDGAFDERRQGGRRSRVVLTPRRWRQVSRKCPRGDGDKKARSPGRARRKPLKPLRRECRVFSGVTAVTNARVYYTTRGCGRSGRPAFPAPSDFEGGIFLARLARMRGEIAGVCS